MVFCILFQNVCILIFLEIVRNEFFKSYVCQILFVELWPKMILTNQIAGFFEIPISRVSCCMLWIFICG